MSATVELTKALIERPSITPNDEGCFEIIEARLKPLGFNCTRLPFEDVDNLWAVVGDSGPLIAFAGHTDVVPTGDQYQWKFNPFTPTIEDGLLYGRGAADMKGSLAAMITAIEQFMANAKQLNIRIGLLFTSDEEGPAKHGTVKVMEWLEANNQIPTYCIVGEPSSTNKLGDIIKNGRRGSLGCEIDVLGIQGHIAYPHLADNPIHKAAQALSALTQIEWDQGNEYFQPTSFQVSNFNSGTGATNVIPGVSHIVCNFRFSPEVTADSLKQKVEAIFAELNINANFNWNLSGNPFMTPVGELVSAVQEAIESTLGYRAELSTGGGTSDGRFIAPYGCQVIELGPINATIHQIDECVSIADLDKLSQIYCRCLENLNR